MMRKSFTLHLCEDLKYIYFFPLNNGFPPPARIYSGLKFVIMTPKHLSAWQATFQLHCIVCAVSED